MRFAFKRVPDGKRGILRDRPSVGGRERRTNIATDVADYLGMVFEPEPAAFFQLAVTPAVGHAQQCPS